MAETAFLRKVFLFRDLTEDEMEEVLSRTQTRNFPAGAVIIEEGEMGDNKYTEIILSHKCPWRIWGSYLQFLLKQG